MRKDFEPATAARNITGGYRLLILDGHNSHCTYGFCKFAADHNIIIICLPSHTTHALQPCDVACFGPLASAWKSEVNAASADYVEITKRNLLQFYAKARERSLKKSTIISAFAKTGIWPFNRHILDPSVFEPSKNTTTEPAQPLPARLPTLLVPIQVHNNTEQFAPTAGNEVRYIIPLLPALPHTAARVDLHRENQQLRHTIRLAEVQLERDFTQMKLMDTENGRLRKQVHAKEKRKAEKRGTAQGHARLMTGAENLDALAEHDFMKHWKEVMKELAPIFKRIRKEINEHDKKIAAAAAAARKTARGRGRGGRRGRAGGRSRAQGQGRGRGRGRGMHSNVLEEESEGEHFDGLSSSSESSDKSMPSGFSKSGEEDESDGEEEEEAPDARPFQTPPIQPAQPRPRPRPAYRMTAPAVDVTEAATDRADNVGVQSQIGSVPIVAGIVDGAGTAAEGRNAVENERRYPRRSNRTNVHFTQGIDA